MSNSFQLGPLQKEWIRALRSGEFKQTKRRLIALNSEGDECGRCCLGVACAAIQKSYGLLRLEKRGDVMTVNNNDATLPDAVVIPMKFHAKNGHLCGTLLRNCKTLAGVNDNTDATFAEIADFVEAHPEAVFTGPA